MVGRSQPVNASRSDERGPGNDEEVSRRTWYRRKKDGTEKERLLGLSRLQLVAAAEILRLLVDEHEPWPDDDKAPLTLLQETWIKTQQSVDILGELNETRSAADT